MKCIDTDFLIAILRGKQDAKRKMEELDQEGRHATTAVTSFELLYGAYRSREKSDNVEEAKVLLGRLDVLPLDLGSSDKAGEILASLADDGKAIDFRDALIAGISIANSLPLITRNNEHFSRVKGLKIEKW